MRTKSYLLALLSSVLLLQACMKDDSDTVVATKEELLTHHTWKMEELTQVENNTQIYYKRGGTTNTNDFDNDKITFLVDGTGTYTPTPTQNFNITWEFTNTSKTQMNIVITFSPSLVTTLKCTELELTQKRFFCVTNFLNASDQPVLGSVYRTPL
jgi:hypothetical protein